MTLNTKKKCSTMTKVSCVGAYLRSNAMVEYFKWHNLTEIKPGFEDSASRQNIYFYLGYTRCKIYWAKLEGPRGSDFNFVIKSLRRHEKLGSIPKVWNSGNFFA
jgi:hypothetical protein